MTAEYQTPLGDFDRFDDESRLTNQPEQERREPGFYPSLQDALAPFVGSEAAQNIAEIQTGDKNIHKEDLHTPISTTRDRLPTRDEIAQEVLGAASSQTETTIQILKPSKPIVWSPEIAHEWRRSKNPELKKLGKLLWTGEQVLYRFEVEENGERKVMFVSDPKLDVRGIPVHRIEKYERVGDPENPEFKVTYHPYGLGKTPLASEVDEEIPELTGEVEVYDQGRLQITKIRREVRNNKPDGSTEVSTEVIFCGITNKASGETFVLNDVRPEFVLLETGKKIGSNIPDYPYIVLPDGKPSNDRDLRTIGQELAGIDLYLEAFEEGIDPFLKYFAARQVDAAVTTGNRGLLGVNALGLTGIGLALAAEDESRTVGGAMAFTALAALTYGQVRFGSRYSEMKTATNERANSFVKKLDSRGISFE